MKANYKTQAAVIAILAALALPTSAQAKKTYQCVKPATAETIHKVRPRGNWGPQHNTNNWSYSAVNGEDIYRRNGKHRTVGTRCSKGGISSYNLGTLHIDYVGNQDYCVTVIPGEPKKTATPFCAEAQGFTLNADQLTCTRPAKPAYWLKKRKPKGNWGPQHNTNNWTYAAINGADIYRRNGKKRTVGTRCSKGGVGSYDYGTLKIDLEGNQDYCAMRIAATPAKTEKVRCHNGYRLRVVSRPNGASGASAGSASTGSISGSKPILGTGGVLIAKPGAGGVLTKPGTSKPGGGFEVLKPKPILDTGRIDSVIFKPKPLSPTLPSCCSPWNESMLKESLKYQGSGNIMDPYTLRYNPAASVNAQMEAYINYLHALDSGVTSIIINFRLFDKGQNPNSPGLGTQVGSHHFVAWDAGGSSAPSNGGGNFFNMPSQNMKINNWYRVASGTYLNDGKVAFGKDCANNDFLINIEISGMKSSTGGQQVILKTMKDGKITRRVLPTAKTEPSNMKSRRKRFQRKDKK